MVYRDRSAPVVATVAHVQAGYFDEPDDWVGISHVLEHMFFKGSSGWGPGEATREIQLLGGYLNASTIYDKTAYHTVLPASDGALRRAVDLQADALIRPSLDAAELARELAVIIQEAKRKLDSPQALAGETLYELLFRVHRMRRWRIGTEDGLQRLTAADLRAYHATRYTPDRTVLALVGDLTVSDALEAAEAAFGDWSSSKSAVPRPPQEPDIARADLRVMHGDILTPLAVVGWRTQDALHPDTPALDMAAAVLGAGRGGWLYRGLRVPGLASAVQSFHYTPTEVGVFEISLESDSSQFDDAVAAAMGLAGGLRRRTGGALDLRRVRALTAARWARRFETMDGRAASLCAFEALGDYRLADELYGRAMSVSAGDVRRAASRYLDPAAASAVLYLPRGGETEYTMATWPPRPARRTLRATPARRTPHLRSKTTSGVAARHGRVWHAALPGVDLLTREKRGSGLAVIGVYLPHLRERESSATAGLTALLVRSALRGAAGMPGEGLAAAAERLGGPIVPFIGLHAAGWEMTLPVVSLGRAAELLCRVAQEPELDAASLEIERALQVADARRERDDMFGHPLRAVLRAAFRDDPMGLPLLGDPESVVALSDDLVRKAAEDLRSRRAAVVAVGDAPADRLLEALSPFERWAAARGHSGGRGNAPSWHAGRTWEERDKAQTALAMAFPAPPYSTPDRFAVSVLRGLLSGLAGRLFRSLRDAKSLAYTVTAMPWLQRRAGAFLTYIATSPEREDEAREAMLLELSTVARDEIHADELDRARNYVAGSVELRQQSSRAVATGILHAWAHGTLDDLDMEVENLRSVSAGDLARVAARVFDLEKRAEFVARGSGGAR